MPLLLRVHADVAVRDAGAGRSTLAQKHVAMLGSSGLGEGRQRSALSASAERVVDRLRVRCDATRPDGEIDAQLASAVGGRRSSLLRPA
jgi:hypothetical protein